MLDSRPPYIQVRSSQIRHQCEKKKIFRSLALLPLAALEASVSATVSVSISVTDSTTKIRPPTGNLICQAKISMYWLVMNMSNRIDCFIEGCSIGSAVFDIHGLGLKVLQHHTSEYYTNSVGIERAPKHPSPKGSSWYSNTPVRQISEVAGKSLHLFTTYLTLSSTHWYPEVIFCAYLLTFGIYPVPINRYSTSILFACFICLFYRHTDYCAASTPIPLHHKANIF